MQNQIQQMIPQLNRFASQIQGNPEELGRNAIKNLNQRQLNELQNQTNYIYKMMSGMGLIK